MRIIVRKNLGKKTQWIFRKLEKVIRKAIKIIKRIIGIRRKPEKNCWGIGIVKKGKKEEKKNKGKEKNWENLNLI